MNTKPVYTHNDKAILNLYGLITAGAVLTMIPVSVVPYAGLACLLVGFVAAYVYKFRHRQNECMAFHTRHIIRTMWWSTLILFLGIAMFACIIVFNGDLSSIHSLMERTERGLLITDVEVRAMQASFVQANLSLISIAALCCLLPYPIYIIARAIKGVKGIKKTG